jgi:hypothetical protein
MIFDKAAAGKRGGGREVLASLPVLFVIGSTTILARLRVGEAMCLTLQGGIRDRDAC